MKQAITTRLRCAEILKYQIGELQITRINVKDANRKGGQR